MAVPTQYSTGQQILTSLAGTELISVDNGGALVSAIPVSLLYTAFPFAISNTVASAATLTLTAANVTGAVSIVYLTITGSTAVTTFTTPTAAQIQAALQSETINTGWVLRIINVSGSTTSALTGGTGVTVSSASSGVLTIANNAWRDFVVDVTNVATPAVSFISVATGTVS